MKWKNKGHEFDELGKLFFKNNQILVLGGEKATRKIKEELEFLNLSVKCNNSIYKNFNPIFVVLNKIIKPRYEELVSEKTIIIADDDRDILEKILNVKGINLNKNVFLASEFFKKYLSIFALYACKKVYSGIGTCLILTTHCTLNCKYCSNFQPYLKSKDKKHKNFEDLIKDVDVFFSCFDRVKYFSLSGGEPMLHPQLEELIRYIGMNYRHKIWDFEVVTNGSIVPSNEVLKAIRDYKVNILCDDYTINAPFTKESHEKLIQKCKDFGVDYKINHNMVFFKMFPPKIDYTRYTEEQLEEKFTECKNCYSGHELRAGRLYSCCCAGLADTAHIVYAAKNDYMDLNDYLEEKEELIEFKLDYNDKGYVEFCKYCNGFPNMNGNLDENGVTQVKKGEILEWDMNQPTYL